MTDDPSSSIFGRDAAAELPGLTLDFEQRDHSLGIEAEVAAVIEAAIVAALRASAPKVAAPMDLPVIVTDNDESQSLNHEYRGKDKPTNVLSFPALEPGELEDAFRFALAGGPPVMLGDLVIAGPVVVAEAEAQSKPVFHHLAHLCVHGVLHLMGYDHIADDEALEMEALERDILVGFGIPDPYELPDTAEQSDTAELEKDDD